VSLQCIFVVERFFRKARYLAKHGFGSIYV